MHLKNLLFRRLNFMKEMLPALLFFLAIPWSFDFLTGFMLQMVIAGNSRSLACWMVISMFSGYEKYFSTWMTKLVSSANTAPVVARIQKAFLMRPENVLKI